MGKDREGKFHPAKGKPSGANKEEGLGLRKSFNPDDLERDEEITARYTTGEDELSPDVPVRHPNRNVSKGEDFSGSNDAAYKSKEQSHTEEVSKTSPEELPGILTKDFFNVLAAHRHPVSVSILLPTHRAGVEVNEQVDMIAFKNALQHAEKLLSAKNTDAVLVKKILEPAYELLRDDKFWYSLTDGLAVYISEDVFKFIRLPAAPVATTAVDGSFVMRPLLDFMVRMEYFYLLVISKKQAKFYRADAFGIEHIPVDALPDGVDDVVHFENKDDQKLFRTGGRGGTGGANFHGIGAGKPDEKTHIALYFEEVDDTLWKSHLHRANVPLVLAGVDYLIPIYRSVTDYNNIWEQALTGNYEHTSDKELYQQAMQLMQPYFDRNLNRALEDYGNKSATQLTSSVIADIIPAAYYGRISHLFVQRSASLRGSFDEASNKLQLDDQGNETNEDLIDMAVIKTIQTGGQVFVLEAEKMPQPSELAAIFYY